MLLISLWQTSVAKTFAALHGQFRDLITDEVRALPIEQRLTWLKKQLSLELDENKRYFYARELFMTYRNLKKYTAAKALCLSTTIPLNDDFYYREKCLEVQKGDMELNAYLIQLTSLLNHAKKLQNDDETVWLNKRLGWEHSMAGNVSQSLAHFNDALKYIPNRKDRLAMQVMQDIATVYIINGDENYIRKGMAIHQAVIHDIDRILANAGEDKALRRRFQRTRKVSTFNQGIAKMMHLNEELEALPFFKELLFKASAEDFLYYDALIYTTYLTARYENDFVKTRSLLDKVAQFKQKPLPTNEYLECYLSLTYFHLRESSDLSLCFNLDEKTSLEVKIDILKRLIKIEDKTIKLRALEQFYQLYINDIEKENRKRITNLASNVEIRRLQLENEFQNKVVGDKLKVIDEINYKQQFYIFSISFLVLFVFYSFYRSRALKHQINNFQQLSLVDPLTGLGNRRLLQEDFPLMVKQLQQERLHNDDYCLALMELSVLGLQDITALQGSSVADEIKVKVAELLQDPTLNHIHIYDLGRDTFLLIADIDHSAQLKKLAVSILQHLKSANLSISTWDNSKLAYALGGLTLPFYKEPLKRIQWQRYARFADFALRKALEQNHSCIILVKENGIDLFDSANLGRFGSNLNFALDKNHIQVEQIEL